MMDRVQSAPCKFPVVLASQVGHFGRHWPSAVSLCAPRSVIAECDTCFPCCCDGNVWCCATRSAGLHTSAT